MGLDMFLERAPRYKGYTLEDVRSVEDYLDMERVNKKEGKNYSFKEWCGREKEPSKALIDHYKKYYKESYSDWDKEHRYPYFAIIEGAGYWRKANAIHRWFVDNIQNGEDDCKYHREVTEDDLNELISLCEKVILASRLVKKDGTCIIEDRSVAEDLLPVQDGFFFGSTSYDECYLNDLKDTIKICQEALVTTDFDKQMLGYCSSW